MSRSLAHEFQGFLDLIEPQTLNNAAISSAYVDASKWDQLELIFLEGANAAGGSITISAAEATDAAGTGTQAYTLTGIAAMATADRACRVIVKTNKLSAGFTHIRFTLAETATQNVIVCAAVVGYHYKSAAGNAADAVIGQSALCTQTIKLV